MKYLFGYQGNNIEIHVSNIHIIVLWEEKYDDSTVNFGQVIPRDGKINQRENENVLEIIQKS